LNSNKNLLYTQLGQSRGFSQLGGENSLLMLIPFLRKIFDNKFFSTA